MNKYALPILLEAGAQKEYPAEKMNKNLEIQYRNVFMNVIKKDLVVPIFIAMGYVFLPHHAISSRIIKGINGAILYGVLYILMSADIVRHFL